MMKNQMDWDTTIPNIHQNNKFVICVNRSIGFIRTCFNAINNYRSSTYDEKNENKNQVKNELNVIKCVKPSYLLPFGRKTSMAINETIKINIKKKMFVINRECSQAYTDIYFSIPSNAILLLTGNDNLNTRIQVLDNNINTNELVQLNVMGKQNYGTFLLAADSTIANATIVIIEPLHFIECVPEKRFVPIFLSFFENHECTITATTTSAYNIEKNKSDTMISKLLKYNCDDILFCNFAFDNEPIYYVRIDKRAISPLATSYSKLNDLVYKFDIHTLENITIGPQESIKIESGYFFFRKPGKKSCKYFVLILTLPIMCKRGLIPTETIIDIDMVKFAVTLKNLTSHTQTLSAKTKIASCVLRKSM